MRVSFTGYCERVRQFRSKYKNDPQLLTRIKKNIAGVEKMDCTIFKQKKPKNNELIRFLLTRTM